MKRFFYTLMILLLVPCVTATAQNQSAGKNITYQCKDENLADALRKVERLSGYYKMQFSLDEVAPYRVTVNLVEATMDETIKELIHDTKLHYNIKNRFVQIFRDVPAQGGNIAMGRISDASGEPLPGAVVRVKETGKGAVTDIIGNYTIEVEQGQTLLFGFVGMETQEVVFSGFSPLDITLVDSKNNTLENVVVTGIFTKPRESYTGAVSTINSEQIQLYKGQNLLQTLKNIDASLNFQIDNINGSNPNNLPEINIRGNASLPTNVAEFNEGLQNSTNTPLIIMDGFEISLTKLMDYNDDEIESINILKDAAATAIYGSRGANGVIVVVTKRPEVGKLKINLEAGTTIEMPDLTSYDLLNARQKLQLEYDAGLYDVPGVPSRDIEKKQLYYNRLRQVLSGTDTDWLSKPVRTGVGQFYKARFGGGSDEFRWGASLGYQDTEGAMKGSKRETFNGSITLMYNMKNLVFRNYTSISENNSQESKYGNYSTYAKQQPYNSPYDADGNLIHYFHSFSGNSKVLNPLYDASLNTFNKSGYTSLTNQFSIDWNIIQSLKLRGSFGIGNTNNTKDHFLPAEHSTFTTDTQYESDEGFLRRGRYTYGTGSNMNYEIDITLAYNETFKEKSQLYAGLDYSIREARGETYNFVAEGFSSDNITSIINARQYATNSKPSGSKSLSRQVGLTANANYTFDNRYYADLSYRIDGSSEYGSNKKFAPFWSMGVGWNIHREHFMSGVKWLNNLKLRASYGETGSQLSSNAGAFTSYEYITDNKYMNWTGAYLTGLGNYDLTWQMTRESDIGIEFGFWNDRVRGTFDYYNKTTDNLLSYMDMPLSTGFASYMANIGEIKNQGFELSTSAYVIRNREQHLNWIVSGQLVYNKNWISKLSDAVKRQNEQYMLQGSDVGTLFFEGNPQSGIYAVQSLGIDPSTGEELFIDKGGNLTKTWNASDKVFLGSSDPLYRGNIGTTLVWRNLTVNSSFGYHWGGYVYNQTLLDKVEVTLNTIQDQNVDSRVLSSRWFKPGDVTFFKRLSNEETHATSRYVMKDQVLRLQSVGLQYRFDGERLSNLLRCNALILALNMNDLLYFSSIKRERGTSYPYSRNIQASLKLSF